MCGNRSLRTLSKLKYWIFIIFCTRSHLEEKTTEILVLENIASLTMLEEEGLALFISETTADAVEYVHESLEIYYSFVLKIDEFEI